MVSTETKPPKKHHQEFEKYLQANWRNDWKNKYLNYGSLNRRVEKSDKLKGIELDTEMLQFFCDCEKELKTVNDFFKEKLEELIDKKETLENEASKMKEASTALEKRKSLRYDFHLLYVDCMMLNNYQKLNFVGFRKILKKIDHHQVKHHQVKSHNEKAKAGEKWRKDNVENASFYSCNKIVPLMKQIEDSYAKFFVKNKDKDTTMEQLLYFHSQKTHKIIYLIPSVFLVMIVLSVILITLYNIFSIPIKI
jgi:SPX domain protein involved in polyphosphate accumulation